MVGIHTSIYIIAFNSLNLCYKIKFLKYLTFIHPNIYDCILKRRNLTMNIVIKLNHSFNKRELLHFVRRVYHLMAAVYYEIGLMV